MCECNVLVAQTLSSYTTGHSQPSSSIFTKLPGCQIRQKSIKSRLFALPKPDSFHTSCSKRIDFERLLPICDLIGV